MDKNQVTDEPVTWYVDDVSKWENWQIDYQFGAFYIFPPEPVRSQINALRETHDLRSQSYCDAHISLTIPLPRAINHKDWTEFTQAVRNIESFTVTYELPTSFPSVPGVALDIEPFERLEEIVLALESVDVFLNAKPRSYRFHPHMTIAEFITFEKTTELLQQLSREKLLGKFECDTIAYAVPNNDFHFSERAFIALSR